MAKKGSLFISMIICSALLFSFASIHDSHAQDVIKLSLAFPSGPQSFTARAHTWWADEVEKRTQGKVKITRHWGGSLATHREMVKAVGVGAADMGDSVWAPYNPQIFPLHTVTDGPVIWSKRPMALAYAGMQLEKEFPEVEAENTKANLIRLTWINPGAINIMTRSKPIRTVADLKGIRIRTAGKFLQPPIIKAAGAVPVGLPFPEVYDAVQKGIADGATGPLGMFLGMKLHEICKYYIVIGFGGDPGQGIMMNLDKWNSMPEDVKKVLVQLKEQDFPKVFIEKFAVPEYQKAMDKLKKQGVETIELPDEELEKWKALEPLDVHVAPWLKRTVKGSGLPEARVMQILNRYKELADKYEKTQTAIW